MITLDNIYTIPVFEKWLIYAPLHGVTALVNKPAIKSLINNNGPKQLVDLLKSKIYSIPKSPTGELFPSFYGIIPTRSCNLKCIYCDFHSHEYNNEKMPYDLAIDSLNWFFKNSKKLGRKEIKIHFFGGEPFNAFDIIDLIFKRSKKLSKQLNIKPYFEVSTNGVFTSKRAKFAGDHFNAIVLSFDGFKKFHDKNRNASFNNVFNTAKILSKSNTKLCFRMCVTNESVTTLPDTANWFCSEFRPSIICFETLKPTLLSKSAGLKPPSPYKFAQSFIKASLIAAEYGVPVVYSSAEDVSPRTSYCPVGTDTSIVSPDGRISSCYLIQEDWVQKGLNLDIGVINNENPKLSKNSIQKIRDLVTDKKRCENCFCQFSCAGGCHVGETYPECSDDYSNFCIQTRIIKASNLLMSIGEDQLAIDFIKTSESMEKAALHFNDSILNNGH